MRRIIFALILVLQLVSCGGSSHVDKTPSRDTSRLNGPASSNAQAAVVQITPVAAKRDDIVDDAILTRLDVVLDPDATVEQVNTALDKLGAKIVSSRASSLFLTISVPRQSDFSSLADLAKQLTDMPGIAFAIPGQQGSNRIIPGYSDASPSISPNMTNDHLLNARLTTAWNAGGKLLDSCLNNPVSLLIVDKFGSLASLDAAMVDNINREFPNYSLVGSVLDDGQTHGWDVAAIAAAEFSPSNQTGAMPFSGCVKLTLLSVSGLTYQQQLDVLDTALRLNGGEKTIVNYSLGFKDRCDGTCTAESIADGSSRADFRQITSSYTRALLAMSWREMSHDLWGDFIITTAGGDEINEPTSVIYPKLSIMGFNSPINLAASGGLDLASGAKNWGDGSGTQPGYDLIGTDDVIYQILLNVTAALTNKDQIENNVIMVGNADIATDSSFNSDFGFDAVYALGENRLNLAGTDTVSGTSLSAPQVAGLAAYLWALDPSLKDRPMADTIHAIVDNTRLTDSGANIAMLDAYAATLSLDKDTASSPPDAPIRESILDVNNDGFFNQDDLTMYANVYGLKTAPNPRTVLGYLGDYDRFDLNGNWFSLKETGRFDLDPENSTYLGAANYSTVNLKIGTTNIPLDENNLTKTQILCYYAYSPLYLGDELTRSTLLPLSVCGGDTKIAFESNRDGNPEIYVMNADGSNPVNLTQNPAYDSIPVWSPDGTKIAFISDRDGNNEVYVMNTDGSNPINLSQNPGTDENPVWSPDGTKIAFFSNNRDGNDEIYVMNADGSNPVNLTQNPAIDVTPVWSPDGTKIAFVSKRDGNTEIYVMNANGTNPVNLTQNPGHDDSPIWSPDGAKITFISDRDGNLEIYAMNANGSNPVNLSQNSGYDANPIWSPNGKKIAFISFRDGNEEIYVMNADGSNPVRLTQNPGRQDRLPVWSSDGTKIVFTSRLKFWDIYIMNVDGSNPVNLTKNTSNNDFRPVWSP